MLASRSLPFDPQAEAAGSGDTYEPGPLSQKIMGRRKDDVGFIVLLAGWDRESSGQGTRLPLLIIK